MDNLKLLQRMANGFAEIIKESFPDFTSATIMVDKDGMRNVDAIKWDDCKDGDYDNTKRRELLVMVKSAHGWVDISETQNDYYRKKGILLEGE